MCADNAEFEGTHQNPGVQLLALHMTHQESHPVPERIAKMLLELSQAWCCDHLPGESVLVPNLPLGELFSIAVSNSVCYKCTKVRIPITGLIFYLFILAS